jgi:hypothetical protein
MKTLLTCWVRDSARLAVFALGLTSALGQVQAPAWWATEGVYKKVNGSKVPAMDYGAVNQGQLKRMAIGAYEHLVKSIPPAYGNIWKDGNDVPIATGVALMQLIGQWVEVDDNAPGKTGTGKLFREVLVNGEPTNPPSYSVTGTGKLQLAAAAADDRDFTGVKQGQLKRVAKAFYKRLEDLYRSQNGTVVFPAPWRAGRQWTDDDDTQTTTDLGDDTNYALANSGQLKRVFLFDLLTDADNDGTTDLVEIRNGTANDPADTDGDGVPDIEEFTLGTNPRDKDNPLLQLTVSGFVNP